MAKISSGLISIDNSKLICKPCFSSEKVSKIKYRHRSVSCSLQLESRNSISPTPTILLRRIVCENSCFENKLSFLTYPNNTKNAAASIVDIDFNPDFMNSSLNLEICGQSHGIVCLSDVNDFYKDIFLCNPATKEFRRLPPSTFKLTDDNVVGGIRYQCFTKEVGFGYDPKSNDFKVVRIVSFGTVSRNILDGGSSDLNFGVEVYDLSTDHWRRIETTTLFSRYDIFCHMSHIDEDGFGFNYWCAHKRGKLPISFNMSQEVFQLLPSPVCFPGLGETEDFLPRINSSFLFWNGSMVLFLFKDGREFAMWGIKKNNDESNVVSWSELLTFRPRLGIRKPLVFLNSDELLMETMNWQLVIYNMKTHKIKHLKKDVTGLPYSFQALVFEKSLLSVKAGTSLTS